MPSELKAVPGPERTLTLTSVSAESPPMDVGEGTGVPCVSRMSPLTTGTSGVDLVEMKGAATQPRPDGSAG